MGGAVPGSCSRRAPGDSGGAAPSEAVSRDGVGVPAAAPRPEPHGDGATVDPDAARDRPSHAPDGRNVPASVLEVRAKPTAGLPAAAQHDPMAVSAPAPRAAGSGSDGDGGGAPPPHAPQAEPGWSALDDDGATRPVRASAAKPPQPGAQERALPRSVGWSTPCPAEERDPSLRARDDAGGSEGQGPPPTSPKAWPSGAHDDSAGRSSRRAAANAGTGGQAAAEDASPPSRPASAVPASVQSLDGPGSVEPSHRPGSPVQEDGPPVFMQSRAAPMRERPPPAPAGPGPFAATDDGTGRLPRTPGPRPVSPPSLGPAQHTAVDGEAGPAAPPVAVETAERGSSVERPEMTGLMPHVGPRSPRRQQEPDAAATTSDPDTASRSPRRSDSISRERPQKPLADAAPGSGPEGYARVWPWVGPVFPISRQGRTAPAATDGPERLASRRGLRPTSEAEPPAEFVSRPGRDAPHAAPSQTPASTNRQDGLAPTRDPSNPPEPQRRPLLASRDPASRGLTKDADRPAVGRDLGLGKGIFEQGAPAPEVITPSGRLDPTLHGPIAGVDRSAAELDGRARRGFSKAARAEQPIAARPSARPDAFRDGTRPASRSPASPATAAIGPARSSTSPSARALTPDTVRAPDELRSSNTATSPPEARFIHSATHPKQSMSPPVAREIAAVSIRSPRSKGRAVRVRTPSNAAVAARSQRWLRRMLRRRHYRERRIRIPHPGAHTGTKTPRGASGDGPSGTPGTPGTQPTQRGPAPQPALLSGRQTAIVPHPPAAVPPPVPPAPAGATLRPSSPTDASLGGGAGRRANDAPQSKSVPRPTEFPSSTATDRAGFRPSSAADPATAAAGATPRASLSRALTAPGGGRFAAGPEGAVLGSTGRRSGSPSGRNVQITIEDLVVTAEAPPTSTTTATRRTAPKVTLDEYRRRRGWET